VKNKEQKTEQKIENTAQKFVKKSEKWIRQSPKQVELLEEVITELHKLRVIVHSIAGFLVGYFFYEFYEKYLGPHFDEYTNYVRYLFQNSSNEAKLNLLVVVPATIIGTLLFQKLIPGLFKYFSKK
jgi:hypothetical protein